MIVTCDTQEINKTHSKMNNDIYNDMNLSVKEFDITLARIAYKIELNISDFKNIVNNYAENIDLFDFLNKINYFSNKNYSKTFLRKVKDLCYSINISKDEFLEFGQKYLTMNATVHLSNLLCKVGIFSSNANRKASAENYIKIVNTINSKNQQDLTNTINKHIVEQI